jgi:hypothetical protein
MLTQRLAQNRGLILGEFDSHLAIALVELTKEHCTSVRWISNLDCQYIKRLNWRKYRRIVCSQGFYQKCFERLNRVAGLIDITIVLTDMQELSSLSLLPVPTTIKRRFFETSTRQLINTASL